MKNFIKLLGVCFFAASIFTFNACSNDDNIDTVDIVDGVNVADGLYLAAVGADPVSGAKLESELVEDEGFSAQARTGFVAGYIYLEAGDYNFVQVETVDDTKIVTNTWGGSAEEVTDNGSSCEFNTYTAVSMEVNGAAINVANSGLYRVSYDQLTNEMVMFEVVHPSIIGDATGSWNDDTKLTDGSVTADGGSWTVSDVILRNGLWKVRFNCRWSVSRLLDPNAGFDESNGYQMFTNFGGTTDLLEVGGSNIPQDEDGVYTVTINWNSLDGWSVALERTGDAPTLTFDPNDYNLGVIGSATAGSWDSDRDMIYKYDDGNQIHKWYGVVTLSADGEFKIRANDDWTFNLGGAIAADGVEVTLDDSDGANFATPGAGSYYIVVSTADEGATWQATMTASGWGVIGSATVGGWDADQDMTADGFDSGVTTYTYTGAFSEGEFKMRAGDNWELNLGGTLGGLTVDGSNVTVTTPGDYKVTLNFDGSLYTATFEAQ